MKRLTLAFLSVFRNSICFLPLLLVGMVLVFSPAYLTISHTGDGHVLRGIQLAIEGPRALAFDDFSGPEGHPVAYPPLMNIILGIAWLTGGISLANIAQNLIQIILVFGGTWFVAYTLYGRSSSLLAGILLFFIGGLFQTPSPSHWMAGLAVLLYYAVATRQPRLTLALLVVSTYIHLSTAGLWAALVLYWFLDRKRRAWLQYPLFWSAIAGVPMAALFLWHATSFQPLLGAPSILSQLYAWTPEFPSTLTLSVLAASMWVLWHNRKDEHTVLTGTIVLGTCIVWIASLQYGRMLFALLPLLTVSASRIVAEKPSRFQRVTRPYLISLAFSLIICIAVVAAPSITTSLAESVSRDNAHAQPFFEAGRQTRGIEDASRAFAAFTLPGELVQSRDVESIVLAWMTGRRVSSYLLGWWYTSTPISEDRWRTSFYKISPAQLPDYFYQSRIVYAGPAGILFVRPTNGTIGCSTHPAYCRALVERDDSLCQSLPTQRKIHDCILDVASTTSLFHPQKNATICKQLPDAERAYCYVLASGSRNNYGIVVPYGTDLLDLGNNTGIQVVSFPTRNNSAG